MTKTKYLYNVEPSHFADMEFYDAIRERIRLAKILRDSLVADKKGFFSERRRKVEKALDWNLDIMEEEKDTSLILEDISLCSFKNTKEEKNSYNGAFSKFRQSVIDFMNELTNQIDRFLKDYRS